MASPDVGDGPVAESTRWGLPMEDGVGDNPPVRMVLVSDSRIRSSASYEVCPYWRLRGRHTRLPDLAPLCVKTQSAMEF